jgi:hypothetical protein
MKLQAESADLLALPVDHDASSFAVGFGAGEMLFQILHAGLEVDLLDGRLVGGLAELPQLSEPDPELVLKLADLAPLALDHLQAGGTVGLGKLELLLQVDDPLSQGGFGHRFGFVH